MGLLKFWLLEQSFLNRDLSVKFMFSKKATKMDEIFTVDLRVITYLLSNCRWRSCQFCGLLKKRKPCLPFYQIIWMKISHDNNYVQARYCCVKNSDKFFNKVMVNKNEFLKNINLLTVNSLFRIKRCHRSSNHRFWKMFTKTGLWM